MDQSRQMVRAVRHRGPDDEGIYFNPEQDIFLGHVRLSIIDISSSGHQPMSTADGRYIIIFNGEIYNYLDLRHELRAKGVIFKTNSDTEVLLQAFINWDEQCVEKLDGMFAFAIYDTIRRRLVLGRDRFGEKPLYYYSTKSKGLVFGSELRALLSSNLVPRKINNEKLPELLSYQGIHHPNTIVANVFSLPPACIMTSVGDSVSVKKYWQASIAPSRRSTRTHVLSEVKRLLMASIKRKLISDVPVGVFLSGGIDSSIILGAASSISTQPLDTFTVTFDDPNFKDGFYSNIAAKAFRTRHHEIRLNFQDILEDIPNAWRSIDNPSADGLNTYIVSKAVAASGLKVALSGLGGDEIFGGYSSFATLKKVANCSAYLKILPQNFRKFLTERFISDSASIPELKIAEAFKSNLSLEECYLLTRRFFFDFQLKSLIDPLPVTNGNNVKRYSFDRRFTFSAVSLLETDHYMHDVLLKDTDQMSMANGLEVRVPFLDHQLVEYVLSLSDGVKSNGQYQKSLLVDAMREFIPSKLIARPKQGFVMPIESWMRGPLREQCEFNLSCLEAIPHLNQATIRQFWDIFLKGSPSVNWARLWLLINLGAWTFHNRIVG